MASRPLWWSSISCSSSNRALACFRRIWFTRAVCILRASALVWATVSCSSASSSTLRSCHRATSAVSSSRARLRSCSRIASCCCRERWIIATSSALSAATACSFRRAPASTTAASRVYRDSSSFCFVHSCVSITATILSLRTCASARLAVSRAARAKFVSSLRRAKASADFSNPAASTASANRCAFSASFAFAVAAASATAVALFCSFSKTCSSASSSALCRIIAPSFLSSANSALAFERISSICASTKSFVSAARARRSVSLISSAVLATAMACVFSRTKVASCRSNRLFIVSAC
mmetsp:Transcript_6796/g.25676  ORF Transcript_6796/g.25676 Transcript_6796/m.25676 type:complete len:296 (-) Transcript_6796:394-1281(-)